MLQKLLPFKTWFGVGVYLAALVGTLLLSVESLRPYAAILLLLAGLLAVMLWGRQQWLFPFSHNTPFVARVSPGGRSALRFLVIGAGLLVVAADVYQAANPNEVFGLAGWLWLLSIGLLAGSAFALSLHKPAASSLPAATVATRGLASSQAVDLPLAMLPVRRVAGKGLSPFAPTLVSPQAPTWRRWEIGVFAAIVLSALVLRVWNLLDYPNNIYPDEIMTGSIANQSFLGPQRASVFSTVWPGIDLPALWFLIVAVFLKVGGSWLWALRLPAALFGAATVVPFYLLLRNTWGRSTAIVGAAILAFSASNLHYSRLALNNIVAQFFWAACFLFLLRGLRGRRAVDWVLAGLFAGVSEHFYYGTRLLSFILLFFFVYLLVVHRRQAKSYVGYFALTALGYVVGFGPLLGYFVTHSNLYFGRGAQLLVWNHIPTNGEDLGQMAAVLWPIISENLLGISTHTSQDIIYFGPLLMVPEAALLVLGVALLVWKWRHPAAFLMLLSGLGVLFVGGSLVFYPNSVPPLINHWTPAFPAFYCALAIPAGVWLDSVWIRAPKKVVWLKPAILAGGLLLLAWLNLSYYFGSYHADAGSLRSDSYRKAQTYYDLQVAQSRYVASLGPKYAIVTVGTSPAPVDVELTSYLTGNSVDAINLPDPAKSLPLPGVSGRGKAFIFFPGNEQYQALVRTYYPNGKEGQVNSPAGDLLFYTYRVGPGAS